MRKFNKTQITCNAHFIKAAFYLQYALFFIYVYQLNKVDTKTAAAQKSVQLKST